MQVLWKEKNRIKTEAGSFTALLPLLFCAVLKMSCCINRLIWLKYRSGWVVRGKTLRLFLLHPDTSG